MSAASISITIGSTHPLEVTVQSLGIWVIATSRCSAPTSTTHGLMPSTTTNEVLSPGSAHHSDHCVSPSWPTAMHRSAKSPSTLSPSYTTSPPNTPTRSSMNGLVISVDGTSNVSPDNATSGGTAVDAGAEGAVVGTAVVGASEATGAVVGAAVGSA